MGKVILEGPSRWGASGGLRRPSPASFPIAGDFFKWPLAKFSGLGMTAGRLGFIYYETTSMADGTGQVGVSRRSNLKQVVWKSSLLQGSPVLLSTG
jgi:hypothetical protein